MRLLREPRLGARAVRHGFGLRGATPPAELARPRQVHGAAVTDAGACRGPGPPPEADAIVSDTPGLAVGVLTADCVPILLASRRARAVAAVHAGWRGLARGVVAAAVDALAQRAGAAAEELVAGIGPHIGPCCYEVDEPVLTALEASHGGPLLAELARPGRRGHAMLDLGGLAAAALARAGVPPDAVGRAAAFCTCCDAERFHSYRRDGARAGRLVHFIAAAGEEA